MEDQTKSSVQTQTTQTTTEKTSTTSTIVDTNVIQDKDYVLFKCLDGSSRINQIQKGGSIQLSHKHIKTGQFIGHKWGSYYEIDPKSGKLNVCTETPEEVLNIEPKIDDLVNSANSKNETTTTTSTTTENNTNEEKTNEQSNENTAEQIDDKNYKALPSQSNAQTLSTEQIMEMKGDGVSTSKLVQSLVESSATFKDRTEWSKKKYILKKRKRHTEIWWTVKPSAFALAEHYFDGKSDKISELRADSLARILHLGDVQANGVIGVMETCSGLVSGSVLNRIGSHGTGRLVDIGTAKSTDGNIFHQFNFKPDVLEKSTFVHLDRLNPILNGDLPAPTPGDTKFQLKKDGLDSLIIVTRWDPIEIFDLVFNFLHSGGVFVVFSSFLQVLTNLMEKISRKYAINMEISETWERDYQVLQDRTHPLVRMSNASGYILWGIKTLSPQQSDDPSSEQAAKKQKTE